MLKLKSYSFMGVRGLPRVIAFCALLTSLVLLLGQYNVLSAKVITATNQRIVLYNFSTTQYNFQDMKELMNKTIHNKDQKEVNQLVDVSVHQKHHNGSGKPLTVEDACFNDCIGFCLSNLFVDDPTMLIIVREESFAYFSGITTFSSKNLDVEIDPPITTL